MFSLCGPLNILCPLFSRNVVCIWQFTGSWLLFRLEGKGGGEFNRSPTLMCLLVALVTSVWYLKVFLISFSAGIVYITFLFTLSGL